LEIAPIYANVSKLLPVPGSVTVSLNNSAVNPDWSRYRRVYEHCELLEFTASAPLDDPALDAEDEPDPLPLPPQAQANGETPQSITLDVLLAHGSYVGSPAGTVVQFDE
jgi:hypothetical protein